MKKHPFRIALESHLDKEASEGKESGGPKNPINKMRPSKPIQE
jgi:hypothetical protein